MRAKQARRSAARRPELLGALEAERDTCVSAFVRSHLGEAGIAAGSTIV